jgi:hypothetical protein
MKSSFPQLVCFSGAVVLFAAAVRLRRFIIPGRPAGSGEGPIRTAAWASFAGGIGLLIAAIVLTILGH